MGPPAHTQGSPRLSDSFGRSASGSLQRPVPVTPGQHLLCTSLITWGGGDDRRPVSSPHTVARPDAPLVRRQAERSQAVALPHSHPPTHAKPPGTHAPAVAWRAPGHAAPSRRLGSGRAWGKQGAKRTGEEREGRGVGAAEGPARVHVTRQGHRRHGQGKRAPTQDPPALDDHNCTRYAFCPVMGCVCWYVCWCVCEGTQFVGVCVSVGGGRGLHVMVVAVGGGGAQQTCGARVALDSEQT
jgi:hypothetical protein